MRNEEVGRLVCAKIVFKVSLMMVMRMMMMMKMMLMKMFDGCY